MARPQIKETKHQFSVMLKPSTVEEIDKLAEKLRLTRSQLMGNLIESALDDAKLLERTGLFKAVIIGDKIMRKFKEALLSGHISLSEKGELEIKK